MLKQWNVDGVMQKQLNKDTIAVIVKIWVWGGGGGGGDWTPDISVRNIKRCQISCYFYQQVKKKISAEKLTESPNPTATELIHVQKENLNRLREC